MVVDVEVHHSGEAFIRSKVDSHIIGRLSRCNVKSIGFQKLNYGSCSRTVTSKVHIKITGNMDFRIGDNV